MLSKQYVGISHIETSCDHRQMAREGGRGRSREGEREKSLNPITYKIKSQKYSYEKSNPIPIFT